MKLEDFKKMSLVDNPELKKEYDELYIKYAVIEELIKYRKRYNLTQKEFGKLVGLKQQPISRFEKGEIDARLSFIEKICRLTRSDREKCCICGSDSKFISSYDIVMGFTKEG